jgi:hypothetical protein
MFFLAFGGEAVPDLQAAQDFPPPTLRTMNSSCKTTRSRSRGVGRRRRSGPCSGDTASGSFNTATCGLSIFTGVMRSGRAASGTATSGCRAICCRAGSDDRENLGEAQGEDAADPLPRRNVDVYVTILEGDSEGLVYPRRPDVCQDEVELAEVDRGLVDVRWPTGLQITLARTCATLPRRSPVSRASRP